LFVSVILCASANATPFDALDAEQRQALADRCLTLEYGPQRAAIPAVRECLIESMDSLPGELPFDEQYALNRSCGDDPECAASERRALDAVDRSPLLGLAADERDLLSRHCRAVQDSGGPAAWIGCLTEGAAELRTGAALERGTLDLDTRRKALFACADREPVLYRACLQQAGVPAAAASTDSLAEPSVARATPADDADAPEPRSVPDADGSSDREAVVDPRDDSLRSRLSSSLENLDDSGRIVLLAAAMLPMLLLLSRWLLRRRQSDDDDYFEDDDDDYPVASVDRSRHGRERYIDDDFDDDFDDGFEGALRDDARPSTMWAEPPAHGLPPELQSDRDDAAVERSRFDQQAERLFEELDGPSGGGDDIDAPPPPPFIAPATPPERPSAEEPDPGPDEEAYRHAPTRLVGLPSDMGGDALDEISLAPPYPADPPLAPEAPDADGAYPAERPVEDLMPADVSPADVSPADVSPVDVSPVDVSLADLEFEEPSFQGVLPEQLSPEDIPPLALHSDFGQWLVAQPEEDRLTHVVEFLVYWMAYGDRRYDDEARHALLEDDTVDGIQAVKRWVLLEDTRAFTDALHWLCADGSPEQREQTLELLIALLVTDAEPTPVQNTLLRFLSDVFDLGTDGLDALWQEGFGVPMPPLPRVDRADWWALQDEQAIAERDAREVAGYPAELRHAALLGLPLRGELEPARIRAACRRAIQRCEPERFRALGERAQQLAARQLERVEQARDALLNRSPS